MSDDHTAAATGFKVGATLQKALREQHHQHDQLHTKLLMNLDTYYITPSSVLWTSDHRRCRSTSFGVLLQLLLPEEFARVQMLRDVLLHDGRVAVAALEKLPTLMLSWGVVLQLDWRMKTEVAHVADVFPPVLMHLQMVVQVEEALIADVAYLRHRPANQAAENDAN